VPVAFDLEAFRRAEPDWTKLRALWMEMEFTRLLKELPAPPVPIVSSNEPVSRLQSAEAVREYLARTGEAPLGLDWAGDHRPPPPEPAAENLDAVLADRARWVVRFWKHIAAELDERGLRAIYDEIERPLIPVLALMERHGIRVDPGRLEVFAKELERQVDNLTREIYALAGEEFNIGSPKQLAHILFEKLKLPSARRTKTGY